MARSLKVLPYWQGSALMVRLENTIPVPNKSNFSCIAGLPTVLRSVREGFVIFGTGSNIENIGSIAVSLTSNRQVLPRNYISIVERTIVQ